MQATAAAVVGGGALGGRWSLRLLRSFGAPLALPFSLCAPMQQLSQGWLEWRQCVALFRVDASAATCAWVQTAPLHMPAWVCGPTFQVEAPLCVCVCVCACQGRRIEPVCSPA